MTSRLFVVLFLALAVSDAHALPPTLTALTPRGAQRGKPVEIVLTGTNLTPTTRLLLPFKATQKVLPDAKPNPARVRLQLTVDAAVTPGTYPLRVATEDGLSPLVLFRVATLPSIAEVEDNNTHEKAQKVTPPVIVDGQCPGGDVDHFRFPVKKGQRYVVEVLSARLGSGVLPQLRITDDKRRLVAADDTQALAGDARVIFVAAGDGEHVVELSDTRYRGGPPAIYRLTIASHDVPGEVFPLGGRRGSNTTFTLRGGTLTKPRTVTRTVEDSAPLAGRMLLPVEGPSSPRVAVGDLPERTWLRTAGEGGTLDVAPPLTVNGRFDRAGQVDRFRFPVAPNTRWRIAVEAEALGSRLDGVLKVSDQAGKQLALVDDVDVPALLPGQQGYRTVDPSLEVTAPAGTKQLLVELRDQRGRGGINFGYRLTIEPADSDFLVNQPVGELNVPRGASALLTVPITRRGYTGPVRLSLLDLPPGYTVAGGEVCAGGSVGLLTIQAPLEGKAGPVWVKLQGQATEPGRNLVRLGRQHLVRSRDVGAASVLPLNGLALAQTAAAPFALTAPAALTIVKGYPLEVPVSVKRVMGQEKLAVQVTGATPDTLPGTFTFKASPAAPANEARFTVSAGIATVEGRTDLVVLGKARVGAVEQTVALPAIPLVVKRAYEVRLASTNLELLPGQTVTLRGTIERQPMFKGPVRLTLSGLPAGVTLAKPLAPIMGNDFAIELKVAPKPAAGTAKLTLTCAATINGQTHTHPALVLAVAVKKEGPTSVRQAGGGAPR